MGALTSSSHSQETWARAVPPEQRAEHEAGHPDDDHHGHRPHAQHLVVEEPEDERVRDRRHGRGRDAEQGAQRDELARGAHGDHAQADDAEGRQAHEQHPPPSQPVSGRACGQEQPTEGQRVGAGDPLQGRGAAAQVTADGRQRDGQQGVVDHLHEEGEAQGGQRDPGGPKRRVGAGRSRGVGGGHGFLLSLERGSIIEHCSIQ